MGKNCQLSTSDSTELQKPESIKHVTPITRNPEQKNCQLTTATKTTQTIGSFNPIPNSKLTTRKPVTRNSLQPIKYFSI